MEEEGNKEEAGKDFRNECGKKESRRRRGMRKHKGGRKGKEVKKSGSRCIGAAVCENTHSALLSPRCLMRRASQE